MRASASATTPIAKAIAIYSFSAPRLREPFAFAFASCAAFSCFRSETSEFFPLTVLRLSTFLHVAPCCYSERGIENEKKIWDVCLHIRYSGHKYLNCSTCLFPFPPVAQAVRPRNEDISISTHRGASPQRRAIDPDELRPRRRVFACASPCAGMQRAQPTNATRPCPSSDPEAAA
jgi:hypothetical protein